MSKCGYRKGTQGGMGKRRINLLLFSSDLLHKRQILKERHLGITLNIRTFHSFIFTKDAANKRAFICCFPEGKSD